MARNPFRKIIASATPRRRRRTLLGMETLEDRRVMATFSVTNGLDDGVGSLRAAIALANADPAPDTIDFAPSVTAVTLTSGQLRISTEMAITGPVGGTVTVQRSSEAGTPDFGTFLIDTGGVAELSNLTITGGKTAQGGGIRANGALTLSSSTVTGNAAGSGGGIYAQSFANITSSNISGNTAFEGGGIYAQGFQLLGAPARSPAIPHLAAAAVSIYMETAMRSSTPARSRAIGQTPMAAGYLPKICRD